jgi:DNA-binding CsgD family transcriptional regulator/PAS domain-containing protein
MSGLEGGFGPARRRRSAPAPDPGSAFAQALLLQLLDPLYESVLRPDGFDRFLGLLSDELRAEVQLLGSSEPKASGARLDHLNHESGLHQLGPALVASGFETRFLFAHRTLHEPAFAPAEAGLFWSVVPHVRRAVQLRLQSARLDPASNPLVSAIDGLPIGVVLLRSQGAPLFANREAQRLLAERDGLTLTPTGLRIARPSEDAKLRLLVGGSDTERCPAHSRGCLAVVRPSGRSPLLLLVSPCATRSLRAAAEAAPVVVFLADPDRVTPPDAQQLVEAFRLSPAQARLSARLCRGETLAAAATNNRITVATARVHLKAAFRKTGTHRQAELVGLLLGTCATARTGAPDAPSRS